MSKYYLNVWQSSLNRGTSCLFHTNDKIEFYNYIKLITKKYIPYKGLFRITKYDDLIYVSFCDNGDAFEEWYFKKPTGKVDSIEYVRLDKLINLL